MSRFRRMNICLWSGLILVIFSSISSVVIFVVIYTTEPRPDAIVVISNANTPQEITLPFPWSWTYSRTKLQSIYNQQRHTQNSILAIHWNRIHAEAAHSSLTNFSKFLLELDESLTLPSIVTWKFTEPATQPQKVRYCGAQFYPQTLQHMHGNISISYLRVHDVLLVQEPSLKASRRNQLMLWIFAANPFIYQDYSTTQYQWQSKYTQRLFTQTQRLLCVFNIKHQNRVHGITVLSDRIQPPWNFGDHYAVIRCNIPAAMYPYLRIMEQQQHIYTPFEIALIDPFELFSDNNQRSISYITVPICVNYEINNGLDIHTMPLRENPTLHIPQTPTVEAWKTLKQNSSMALYHGHKRYNFGVCVIIHETKCDLHPFFNDRKQVIQKIHEWIEYSMSIMGVDHFYIYQHVRLDDVDSDFFWKRVVYPYFKEYGSDLITFIQWKQPFSRQYSFQVSMMNSCVRQFGNDNKYMLMIDMDEIFVPKQSFLHALSSSTKQTVFDIILAIDTKHGDDLIGEFRVNCNIGITCTEQWGCNHRFDTFVERHACIINSSRTDYFGDTQKMIVNPSVVEYQFVHYVDVYRVLNEDYDANKAFEEEDNEYYRYKYLAMQNGNRILQVDVDDYLLCNHMKLSREIFRQTEYIENSVVMQRMVRDFETDVLSKSAVYNKLHAPKQQVLPYLNKHKKQRFCPAP